MANTDTKKREENRGSSFEDYIPLLVLVALTLAAAAAKQFAYQSAGMMSFMSDFMGFFLVIFSMFKFFDLSGFADGFQMYDLLAKPVRPYAFAYPLIELGLGLWYLSGVVTPTLLVLTILVMGFGSLGVGNALRKGLDVDCACMGTVLKVPLSTVALTEDLGMVVMAAIMFFAIV